MSSPGAGADVMVRLRGATIGYDRRPVVHDVDLEVVAGEVVALLGPNGSGKSTMVRGMLGLAWVMGGEVELFGQPVSRLRDRWRVGYVPQRQAGATGLPTTVQEVVASGRVPRLRPWQRFGPEDRARVATAIETVGLDGRERSPMVELSGGQQRRALIARTLAAEADLLVLDEPTAGVDVASQVVAGRDDRRPRARRRHDPLHHPRARRWRCAYRALVRNTFSQSWMPTSITSMAARPQGNAAQRHS